ncbi:MAG: hypothetical protein ACREP5_13140, partial [Candidatus Binatia bacterium]
TALFSARKMPSARRMTKIWKYRRSFVNCGTIVNVRRSNLQTIFRQIASRMCKIDERIRKHRDCRQSPALGAKETPTGNARKRIRMIPKIAAPG